MATKKGWRIETMRAILDQAQYTDRIELLELLVDQLLTNDRDTVLIELRHNEIALQAYTHRLNEIRLNLRRHDLALQQIYEESS